MRDPLESLLPDCHETRAALGAEAHRLIDLLPEGAQAVAAKKRADEVFGKDTDSAPPLEIARAALARKLSRYPLAGLLLYQPSGLTANAEALDLLRGWALAAVLHAAMTGAATHTTWQFAARVVRQLSSDEAWRDVSLRLPALQKLSLFDVRRRLTQWIATETAIDRRRGAQLEHVRRSLDQLAGVPRRRMTPSARKRTEKSLRFAAQAACRSPLQPTSGTVIMINCDDHDHEEEPLMSVEEAADIAERGWLRSEHPDLGEVIEELWEADDTVSSVLQTRNLTQAEARSIVQDGLQAIVAGAGPGVTMLVASLLLGATITELVGLRRKVPETAGFPWWHDGAQGIGLAFAPQVTKAPKPPLGSFVIMLPEPVASAVRVALNLDLQAEEFEEQAKAWLRHRPGRNQRLSRIAQCLRTALAGAGVDAAITGMLCRSDIRSTPQKYYTCVHASHLEEAYRHFAADWLAMDPTTLNVRTIIPGKRMLGSRCVPKDKHVADFFAKLGSDLDTAAERMESHLPGALSGYHAAFVAAQAGLLAFTTAARPHLEACPPFAQMQLIGPHPVIRIMDKGNRQVDDARWLPVCSVQREAFTQLRRHLECLKSWAMPTSPSLVQYIDRALAGDCSPLFFLNDGDLTPTPLRWAEYWAAQCPPRQVRNMFRHFWRSRLVATNIPSWMIDFHFGHGGWHSAQYLPLSAYRAADLAPLREVIEAEVRSQGIKAPQSRRFPE